MKPDAVFLDRDGVINNKRGNYIKDPREFRLLPHAKDAIKLSLFLLPERPKSHKILPIVLKGGGDILGKENLLNFNLFFSNLERSV